MKEVNYKETKNMSVFDLSNEVGTVLQDPDSQFIGLTVAEDIAFKLENDCVLLDDMKKRVEKVSKIVDIEKRLESSPHNLSGGQKQRVTLGGVMISDNNILLFDEPLASLDPASGKSAIELIDDIQKKSNKTIIIIEHRLEDVLHCNVDRIIVVNDGQIAADLTTQELLSSDILVDTGIREPLYITALKYAGIKVDKDISPESIDSLKVDSIKDKLNNWYDKAEVKSKDEAKETILELDKIKFGYEDKKEILKGVSFKINRGEMVSMVGRNGAGKSTIAKLICGFYKPSSGDILLNGKSIADHSIKERSEKIGFVMQNPNSMISKNMIFDEVALG